MTGVQSTRYLPVTEQIDVAFLQFVFFGAICGYIIHPTSKVSVEANIDVEC